MNDLMQTELFILMNNDSQEINEQELSNAYGRFILQLDSISQVNDLTIIIRKLNITRIELISLQAQFRYEQGKKCA